MIQDDPFEFRVTDRTAYYELKNRSDMEKGYYDSG